MDNFSTRLAALREERRQTRREVAEAIGVTAAQIRYWEGGISNPNPEGLIALAKHYEVSLHWLLMGEGPKRREAIANTVDTDTPNLEEELEELVNHTPWQLWQRLWSLSIVRLGAYWNIRDAAKESMANPKSTEAERRVAEDTLLWLKNRYFVDPDDEEAAALVAEHRALMAEAPDDEAPMLDVAEPPVQKDGYTETVVRTYSKGKEPVKQKPDKKKRKNG